MATSKSPVLVRDVMSRNPVCATGGMGMRELARLFEEKRISGAPVVGTDGRMIGVISKTDLIRRTSDGSIDTPPNYLFEVLVGTAPKGSQVVPESLLVVADLMTPDPVTAQPDEPVGPVARRMAEKRIHRVLVLDADRRPVGVVTTLDLLKVFPV